MLSFLYISEKVSLQSTKMGDPEFRFWEDKHLPLDPSSIAGKN